MKEIKDRCISKKEYLQKYDSNVGYALYVQDNIRKDDYVRLNTGEIVRVIGIRENNVNKKAIYYGMHETEWFDSLATENFSDNIIDLIECGDYVNGNRVYKITNTCIYCVGKAIQNKFSINIGTILTKERFEQNLYKV